MTPWLDAFVPAFGLLLLGYGLRRRLLPDPAVWAGIERLVFWVLLPALLVGAIGTVDLSRLPIGGMAAAIWGTLLAGTALCLLLARAMGVGHAAATSVLQGGIRYNNLLAFAVAGAVFGAPGLALGAVATGLIVPLVQVIITIAFAAGGAARPGPGPLAMARMVGLNPLILACLAGFAVALLGGPPAGVGPLLRALGQASVALGLLAVGAALTLETLRARLGLQAATAALKLLLVPAIALLLARLVGLDPLAAAVVTAFMAQPTATTSYVMARAMGGDAPLMAAMISTQHLLAVLTLPLWMLLLGG